MPIKRSPTSSGTPIQPLTRPPPWVSSLKCSKRSETLAMMTGSRVSIDVGGGIVGIAPVEALPEQIVKVRESRARRR